MSGKVAIAFGEVPADAPPDEQDTLAQVAQVEAALRQLGQASERLPVSLDLGALRQRLKIDRPAAIFNLIESLAGQGQLIALAPQLFESLGIPLAGCSARALALCCDKPAAKRWLVAHDLPTAPWYEAGPLAAGETPLPGRYIVKSVWEHASIGLGPDSVVEADEVTSRLADRQRRLGGSWFAERYIEGREFNIALLDGPDGPQVLPIAEIDFLDFPAGAPRIVDYAAKWLPDSFAYSHTPRRFTFAAGEASLLAELRQLSLRCWEVFGLAGFARVDFRVDAEGRPWILEINPNPCLSSDAGFAAAAAEAGLGAADVVARILAAATAQPTRPLRFREDVREGDAKRVAVLVAACGNFQPSEVEIAGELVLEALARGSEESGYHFLFAERGAELAGYVCFGPIAGTERRFDLYWIGVAPARQRGGLGRDLLHRAEAAMQRLGAARVYLETETTAAYAVARAFYLRNGYRLDAELTDFYRPGAGKAIFVKDL